MRAKKGLIAALFITAFIAPMVVQAGINERMASFDRKYVREPQYQAISYTSMVHDPTPDHLYSYGVDNWHYTDRFIEAFMIAKGITGSRYVILVVAMADGSFIAATVDFDAVELLPGYVEVKRPTELFVTEEFLAKFVQYLDTDPELGAVKDFLMAEYDVEWYMKQWGFKVPKWVVGVMLGSIVAAAGIFITRRR